MIKKALIAAAALLAFSAHAGYAQLANPEGFAGSAGKWTYAANAANDKVYGKVIHSPGALTTTVGGQAVKMPAAYRLAANAPRIAAAVIFAHPGLRVAIGIATWLGIGKVVWDVANNRWARLEDMELVSGGLWMSPASNKGYTSALAACKADFPLVDEAKVKSGGLSATCLINGSSVGTTYLEKDSSFQCPANTRPTDGGCIGQGIEQPEFIESLDPEKMPSTVPLELPYPTPLPIEEPSPWINPAPGPNPDHQPRRVPTGQPEPVPNTNPQQYRQPYIDIIPAPLPDNPWRVDIKPGETTSTSPNSVENPTPDGDDKPVEEQDKSLCEKHPEVAACEKVEVTDKPLPDQPKLYEPKYPEGITGVWNSKMQEIKATPLFNLAPALLPNVSGGSCPSWKIDLSIDGWTNAGLQDVSPPCWVWDVAKLVIIASALLLARRLIFGG